MDTIRVMIVEDSPTVREFLRQVIGAHPQLTVVAECVTGEQALKCLDRIAPDVISMDIHLPGMSGLDTTRLIMEQRPTPIVIVSQSVNAAEMDATMEALRAGAISAIEKPSSRSHGQFQSMSERIQRELVVMSQVKVIRQRFNRPRKGQVLVHRHVPNPLSSSDFKRNPPRMIGMVASTGGPRAVEIILKSLDRDFALPIVLVQHMTSSFQSGFVSWLNRMSPQTVKEACHGEIPRPGFVYIAPHDKHLVVRRDYLELERSEPVCGQRPSGTMLLQSMAEAMGSEAVGVVLTGMGDDGAEGLLAIRRAGGYTIAEDESTAIVDGMPGVAREIEAACTSLPLESIGPALRNLAFTTAEASA
jgi:two-component system chemotaxis response regulator CheB